MDPTTTITTTTEALSADFTSALAANSHALYARDERSVTVDVITVSTSMIGVFIAVVGLIQGYKYWKHNCNHDSPSTAPLGTVQTLNPPQNSIMVDANQVFGIAYAAVLMFLHNAFVAVAPSLSPTAIGNEPDTPRVYDLEAGVVGLRRIRDVEVEEEDRGRVVDSFAARAS
ncbi:uncharacterized protein H6S33_003289 [Morchella sextelata]|uniref:uncharacterized protein n=1 Tax=Morchella sextelata TaxID=1174677 RepID=UPI001D058365|nr:uncharacterized protein H6S33_003289 [Morchella sextelata]KAH0607301.1 hypothetical protein H6S33_003289 [Morchella sextelata]